MSAVAAGFGQLQSTFVDRAGPHIRSGSDYSNFIEFGRTLSGGDIATLKAIKAVEDAVHAADDVIDAAEKLLRIARHGELLVVEPPALQVSTAANSRTEPRAGALVCRHPLRLGRLALFACAAMITTLSLTRDELPIANVADLSRFTRFSPDPAAGEPRASITPRSAPPPQAATVEPMASAAEPVGASHRNIEDTAEAIGSIAIQAALPAGNPPADAPGTSEAIRSETPHTVVRQLDLEHIALLYKRGEELIAVGELAAARFPLRRAAEAGHARSALMLARTYDPILLGKLGTYGLAPDVAMARLWYQRASDLGDSEAGERLQILARPGR
jgi:hypothetical protein